MAMVRVSMSLQWLWADPSFPIRAGAKPGPR